jgi:hypothetical protein
MVCKGICIRHRAQKPVGSFGRYATGQKRCQVCAVYMRWEGLWCPCCGRKVRTRPRNSKFKQKFKQKFKTIIKSEHNKNENGNGKQHHLLIYRENDINAKSGFLSVN